MPRKRPTDFLWTLLAVVQTGLLIWEHGYDRGRDSHSDSTEDPVE